MVTFLRMRRISASVEIGDVFVGDKDAAGIGLEETHDVAQAHGLADAASPDDRQRLARVHAEVDID